MVAGFSCRRQTEAPAAPRTDEPAKAALTAEESLAAKLAGWRQRFETHPELNGKLAFEFGGDTSIPPYESLQFAIKHFEHPGSRVGHFVKIMHRTTGTDPVEAMRCYELIRDEPNTDAIFHGLGLELGKRMPADGLRWLEGFGNSRKRYFAAVNLGTGFAEYAGSHEAGEVEPLFDRFLVSPLFAGEPYDPAQARTGEGSRMRERMTLGVLTSLARAGKLDEGLATRLEPKVPAKCVPALRAYPVLGWPLDRLLDGFDPDDFPEASRKEAVAVGRGRLQEEASLLQAVIWAKGLGDPVLSSTSLRSIYRSFLLKAGDDDVVRILDGIPDPEQFRDAVAFASERANKEKKKVLEGQIGELKRRRLLEESRRIGESHDE